MSERPNGVAEKTPENGANGANGARAPYVSPAVLFVQALEVQASICSAPGKSDAVSCRLGPISS